MFFKISPIIFMFIIANGCGSKESKSINSIPIGQSESLSTYTRSLSIDSNTPEGVGTLLTINEEKYQQRNIGLCTWFLIDNNKALTNSHCIPSSLKNNKNTFCGNVLQGVFQTSKGPKTARCKKIIYSSDISQATVFNNDYALLEIDKSIEDAETFALNRKGFGIDERVKILTMNHAQTATGIYSTFKEQNCVIKSSDLLGKISFPGSSPITGFKEEGSSDFCKTIGGNSGSPVIDESGMLIGILHGGFNKDANLTAGLAFSSNNLTDNISIITNLRCQKLGSESFDKNISDSCETENQRSIRDNSKLISSIQPKIEKLLEEAVANQPSYLEYDIKTRSIGNGSLVTFSPTCIKSTKLWKKDDLKKIFTEGFLSRNKKIKTGIKNYMMNFIISIDYYGDLRMDVNLKESATIWLNISGINDLERKKEVISVLDTSTLGIRNTIENKIPLCSQENVL